MRKTKQLAEDDLYEAAVGALARRDRSVADMRQWLRLRAAQPAAVEAVLRRLRDRGYLDDARFAALAAGHHLEAERHGARRTLRELRAHGIPAPLAERATARAYAGSDEDTLLAAYIRKKRMRAPVNVRQAAAAWRRWMMAGFSPDACRRALAAWRLDPEWLDNLEAAAADAAQENFEADAAARENRED